jgi:ribosomal protein S18 acetylase RimI-like enzyme
MPLFEPAHANVPSSMPVVRTYLELTDPRGIRPAGEPRTNAAIEITKVDPPDGATSRWFYENVGRPHQWTDHLKRTDPEWQAWADRVETWVLTVDGRRAGYYELRHDGEAVEIAYFGLLPEAQGQGLGGHLLTHALRRAFALAPRAWLHTCTLDGPHALANYRARGLRPFRTEVVANG